MLILIKKLLRAITEERSIFSTWASGLNFFLSNFHFVLLLFPFLVVVRLQIVVNEENYY